MERSFCNRFLAGIACMLMLPASGFTADAVPTISVVASFSILGDLVRVVGGERVRVTTLVGADENAHAFEPRPADARAIVQSRLLVINGLGFEPWAQKLAKSAGYEGETVVASQGIKARRMAQEKSPGRHSHEEADPHAWQDPDNTVVYVSNIAAALAKVDPAGASAYQANALAYIQEIKALDHWAKEQFSAVALTKRKVITSHDAFGYLGAHYQITFLAPQGVSTEAEPSAKGVAQLIRQIQREKIRAVFVENMASSKLLAQLARDAGVTVGAPLYADALSNADKPGATYLRMMRHNVTQLAAGMKLN